MELGMGRGGAGLRRGWDWWWFPLPDGIRPPQFGIHSTEGAELMSPTGATAALLRVREEMLRVALVS